RRDPDAVALGLPRHRARDRAADAPRELEGAGAPRRPPARGYGGGGLPGLPPLPRPLHAHAAGRRRPPPQDRDRHGDGHLPPQPVHRVGGRLGPHQGEPHRGVGHRHRVRVLRRDLQRGVGEELHPQRLPAPVVQARPRRARGRAVDVEPGGLDCLPGEPVGGVAVLGAHTGARLWRGARVAHPLHARLHYVHHVGFPGDVHAADRGGRGPHGTRPETTEPVTLPPRRSGIFHSLAWLTASNAVVKPLWFLFITVGCIRVLGAAEYGTLTAGLALAGMVIALSEVGTS